MHGTMVGMVMIAAPSFFICSFGLALQQQPRSVHQHERRKSQQALHVPSNINTIQQQQHQNQNQKKGAVYELDSPNAAHDYLPSFSSSLRVSMVRLGSSKAKRRLSSYENRITQEIQDLQTEHVELKHQCHKLAANSRNHGFEDEIKRLKRHKLFVKDKMLALQTSMNNLHVNNNGNDANQNDDGNETSKSDASLPSTDKRGVVGSGGFGTVLLGHHIVSEDINGIAGSSTIAEPVAVKIARSSIDNPTLLREANLLQMLSSHTGFVRVLHIEHDLQQQQQPTLATEESGGPITALVLDLLGPSMEDIWWSITCGTSGLSGYSVLFLADQMLQRLEDMKDCGIVHRDIQPANILLGRKHEEKNVSHLIDFGIAMHQQQIKKASSAQQEQQHAFSGTPRFASVSALSNGHGGGNQYSDDLESLCYTLAFLRTGRVPWSESLEDEACNAAKSSTVTAKDNKVLSNRQQTCEAALRLARAKAEVLPQDICGKDLREEGDVCAIAIGQLLFHARACNNSSINKNKQQQQQPDYQRCRSIIRDCLSSIIKQKKSINNKDEVSIEETLDWDDCFITWSEDDATLTNTLYSS